MCRVSYEVCTVAKTENYLFTEVSEPLGGIDKIDEFLIQSVHFFVQKTLEENKLNFILGLYASWS